MLCLFYDKVKQSYSCVNTFERNCDLPVSLIKHDILHTVQLQVHVCDDVHETSRGANNSVGRQQISDLYFLNMHMGKTI